MQDADVSTIVPSTRDLLQVLSTRRRNLALLGLIGTEGPAEEAARLAELNVSAFACVEPGAAMSLVARATKTVPLLCTAPASDRAHMLAARQHGADGVCIDATLPLDAWDRLAKIARAMRMMPLALASDASGIAGAQDVGARALLVRAPTAQALLELVRSVPRALTLVALVEEADAAAMRMLAGKVDAAVVLPALHKAPLFAALVAEVDP